MASRGEGRWCNYKACIILGYFLKLVFLSETVPCKSTYLPTYLPEWDRAVYLVSQTDFINFCEDNRSHVYKALDVSRMSKERRHLMQSYHFGMLPAPYMAGLRHAPSTRSILAVSHPGQDFFCWGSPYPVFPGHSHGKWFRLYTDEPAARSHRADRGR
jgi:hypothetical protein